MIRVSFSFFLSLSVFCYFTLLLIFIKIILLLLLFYLFISHENYFYFFMFRDVPGCSGMFRHVGMFLVRGFIDALQNSVVVVQNNGKGKTKKRAARTNLLFAD